MPTGAIVEILDVFADCHGGLGVGSPPGWIAVPFQRSLDDVIVIVAVLSTRAGLDTARPGKSGPSAPARAVAEPPPSPRFAHDATCARQSTAPLLG